MVTDSERFYTSVLELFDNPEEQEEVNELLSWWNRRVSKKKILYCPPESQCVQQTGLSDAINKSRHVSKDSVLARIKEKCVEWRALSACQLSS